MALWPRTPRNPTTGWFKNLLPLRLEGAQLMPDGTYLGGHVVLAANDAIPDYSLEQYRGNVANANDGHPSYRYNNATLNLYEYARASMSNGQYQFNPVYELEVSMRTLCHDAAGRDSGTDARVEQGVTALYTDLSQTVAVWRQHDLRVAYHGASLKDALADAYAEQDRACAATGTGPSPLDRFMRRPETDVPR